MKNTIIQDIEQLPGAVKQHWATQPPLHREDLERGQRTQTHKITISIKE